MAGIVDRTLLQALLPDIQISESQEEKNRLPVEEKADSFPSYRNPVAVHDLGDEQTAIRPQVEDKPTQTVAVDECQCSLRNFVKAIALSKKLYRDWFSVDEAVGGVKEQGYALSTDTALEYLTYLVQRGYFLIRGEGETAQYQKCVFTYAMDFWYDSSNDSMSQQK